MRFLHRSDEFGELLRIVAASRPEQASVAVVEKDYWVTHTLWALQRQGFELWFKGGTALSKGFGLLQRFSEDLDLALEPGTVPGLVHRVDWKRAGKTAREQRRAYFTALEQAISVPDCELELPGTSGEAVVDRVILVRYPARSAERLPRGMRAHVQLELGRARVHPALERELDSWVHAFVRSRGRQTEFEDNRPKALRCVHPLVTLLEKLEAISRKFARSDVEPTAYVRHYEDAARIIEHQERPAATGGDACRALGRHVAPQGSAASPCGNGSGLPSRFQREMARNAQGPPTDRAALLGRAPPVGRRLRADSRLAVGAGEEDMIVRAAAYSPIRASRIWVVWRGVARISAWVR
jgi:hypothetical protein